MLLNFIRNGQGAKVYKDVNKNPLLEIPYLNSDTEKGIIVKVKSIGFVGVTQTPIITIEEDKKAKAYRLPIEYKGWAKNATISFTPDMFPIEFEFGVLKGKHYAEFL